MTFAIALGVAAVATPLLALIARAAGHVDRPDGDDLKIHRRAVPLSGGVAAVAGTLVAILVAGAVGWAIASAILVALVSGLVDDRRPLPPWIRLGLQAGAGVLLVAGGIRVDPLGPLAEAGTVLLVLLCANAVNMMDGQDGLAGGLGAIAAGGLAGASILAGGDAGPGLALAGGLTGFLVWNFPRARVFLGNGGAYAAGTALAGLAALLSETAGWPGLLAAGLCMGPFAAELSFTVLRRLGSRETLTAGDRLHSYDLLAGRVGRTASTLVFWAVGAASSGLGLLVVGLSGPAGAAIVAAAAAMTLAAGLVLWKQADLRRRHQDPYAEGGMRAHPSPPTVRP
jgi:UDP-N-acetylmuramyl pentapeptide phosphotransferase/UDP-N-acetylglucosamine-1-phosphate transferase